MATAGKNLPPAVQGGFSRGEHDVVAFQEAEAAGFAGLVVTRQAPLGDGGFVDDSFGLAFSRHRTVRLDYAVAALFGCCLRSQSPLHCAWR